MLYSSDFQCMNTSGVILCFTIKNYIINYLINLEKIQFLIEGYKSQSIKKCFQLMYFKKGELI